MTKREVAKEIKLVCAGYSIHTWIGVEKLKKGWEIYTSMNNPHMQLNFKHDRNKMTIKEAEQLLNDALYNGLQNID